jgi:hypothetical protein
LGRFVTGANSGPRVSLAFAHRFAFAAVSALRSVMGFPKKKPPGGGWLCGGDREILDYRKQLDIPRLLGEVMKRNELLVEMAERALVLSVIMPRVATKVILSTWLWTGVVLFGSLLLAGYPFPLAASFGFLACAIRFVPISTRFIERFVVLVFAISVAINSGIAVESFIASARKIFAVTASLWF